MGTATPTLDAVVNAILTVLTGYLPAPVGGLPNPNVTASSVQEKAAGIGRKVGNDSVSSFGVVDLKAVRTEVVAQFQLWGTAPTEVDTAISSLTTSILADRDHLWSLGFLKLVMESAEPAENVPGVGWRKLARYRTLYEFPYHDDSADSIIARIPIGIDSTFNESTVVTDDMVRWDNEAAPPLVARGQFSIGAISALTFVSGPAPTGSVTLTRTFDGATGAPVPHPSLTSFLTAIAGTAPAEKHASVIFASVNDFLAALGPAGGPVIMGDWNLDGIPDQYLPQMLTIQPPILLKVVEDRFEIKYQNPALNQIAVLYLRVGRSAAA